MKKEKVSSIVHDFMERVVVANIDSDQEQLKDLYWEFLTFYQSSSDKKVIRGEIYELLSSTNDSAIGFFSDFLL